MIGRTNGTYTQTKTTSLASVVNIQMPNSIFKQENFVRLISLHACPFGRCGRTTTRAEQTITIQWLRSGDERHACKSAWQPARPDEVGVWEMGESGGGEVDSFGAMPGLVALTRDEVRHLVFLSQERLFIEAIH